jgi:transposase-like protein
VPGTTRAHWSPGSASWSCACPQDRHGRFSTELFERYQRSEKALVAALAEMYVQGVSTRKVKAITARLAPGRRPRWSVRSGALCGHSFSAAAISAINARLDEELAQFTGRRLDEACPYLILDARYERVRETRVIGNQAVLLAIGIGWDGRRSILAVELANRESRSSWRDFLRQAARARLVGGRVRGLGRPYRAQTGDRRGAAGGRLATLLRALPAQRARLRAAQGRRRLPARAPLAVRPARLRALAGSRCTRTGSRRTAT